MADRKGVGDAIDMASSSAGRSSPDFDLPKAGRSSPDFDRPNMRILLVGKDVSTNSRVGNYMLGRSALDSEAPPDDHQIERVRGKDMMIINCPHLLQLNLSYHQITQTVRECVDLSHPGPHVFILVLQHHDFSKKDYDRAKFVLNCFSDQAIKRSILLTTDAETHSSKRSSVMINDFINNLMKECGGGYLHFNEGQQGWCSEMFKRVDEILKEEPDEYLKCEIYEDAEGSSVDTELHIHKDSVKSERDSYQKDFGKPLEYHKKEKDRGNIQQSQLTEKSKLNVVLCGTDDELLHKTMKESLHQKYFRKAHGCLINVVELPALTRLSEDEVMCKTLHCVSHCDPGVHMFLLIVPVNPWTDENKEEVEKILKIFDSSKNIMLIFTTDVTVNRRVTDFVESNSECKRLISRCGGHYRVLGLKEDEKSKQIPDLLDYVENMKTEPYSLEMYVEAQEKRVKEETKKKNEATLMRMENEIKELKEKIQPEGDEDDPDDLRCLRIVLIGRTGNGKSATGNTILGRKEFKNLLGSDSVMKVCERKVCELDGRSVAVVDTPGLFDTKMPNEKRQEEIVKCVSLSAPGPHAFIIVLSLGRFTKEETDTIDLIKKIFGPKAAQFSIVLFTRGDELTKGGESIEDFVKRTDSEELNKLLRDCGDRYLSFNNNETQDRTQVTKLIKMIEEMKTTNRGRYFTNSMFEEAEMSIKKRMEEILKEKEREIQAHIEELKAKHEIEMENMKKGLEEEKRKADEERVQMENKFKEQEETLRKESEEKEKTEEQKRDEEKQKRLEEEKQQRAEYHKKIEEIKREIEQQRSQYEKREKEREEEDRKREEKYRQDQEKMKHEHKQIIAELQKKQEEEIKKRDLDEQKRSEEEEIERKERHEEQLREKQEEMKKILTEKEREIQAQKDKIKVKHEIEMKNMKKRLEEEKRKADEERVQMENKFKEQEETLRKEFEEKEKTEQQKQEKEKQKRLDEEKQQRVEYDQKIKEMRREIEKQRSKYEKREKEKEDEDRKREEKYRQDQENMKAKEDLIIQLQKKQEEENKKINLDEQKRSEEEEREKQEWVRKIREAENDRKESQEEIKRQQREWEEDKKQQMRKREEEERKRRESHEEQLREKQDEMEKMRKNLNKIIEKERQKKEWERQRRRHYENLEQEREREEKCLKKKDDEGEDSGSDSDSDSESD